MDRRDFPDGKYKDIEGLCKIVDIEEIVEQDYSLTPGRYVGVSIHVDMDFDLRGISEIHTELKSLTKRLILRIKYNLKVYKR